MTEAKHTIPPDDLLSAGQVNPLVDPDCPLETMARVAAVLATLRALLESLPEAEEHSRSGGVPLILDCCVTALELAHGHGRNDGTLPPLAVWREG